MLICTAFLGYMLYDGIVGVADVKQRNQAFIKAWDIALTGQIVGLTQVDHDIGIIDLRLDSIIGEAQQITDFGGEPFYLLQSGQRAKLVEAGLSEMQIGDRLQIAKTGELTILRDNQLISQRKIFFIEHAPFWKKVNWQSIKEDWE